MAKIWDLEKFKENIALIDEFGKSLTYGQLNANANALAETIGHRCLVFSLCSNTIGSVIGYTAFVNNGIVSVQVSSHLEEGLLEILLKAYSPEKKQQIAELREKLKMSKREFEPRWGAE